MTHDKSATWRCTDIKTGSEVEGTLRAYWEASHDPVSDDYTPQEIDAMELFNVWSRTVIHKYPSGLVPIHWFIDYRGDSFATFECMPFQYEHSQRANEENFLTFFTWPVNVMSGKPLNWLELPVIDKLWTKNNSSKGGFIQQATGWKPSIYQPHVYLPALESALRIK
jgi:hypothetical protein